MSSEPIQLTFFDYIECDSNKKMTIQLRWSYSKRSKYEKCARDYYYTYYGATNGDDFLVERIRFLKKLTNRYLEPGSIVHLVIKTFFKKAQQGNIWEPNRLMDWGLKMLREHRDYSRRHPDGHYIPSAKYPPKLLMEFYKRFEQVESLYDEAEDRFRRAINNFSYHPAFESFRTHGQIPGASVEDWIELRYSPHLITGQVDLAYREGNDVIIVDWKIGESDGGGEDSLQLAAYALWALDHFECQPEQIQVYKAFLGSGEVVPFTVTSEKLNTARARILQDADRMAAMDSYGSQGIASAFTPCYQERICRNCAFEELCYDQN